ncbi:20987_t:CDS:1 [Dentiscutata erythropus]|uniref:20987_t:CDS:1 n=1 Tax=Dentiscutata erythropus TaxID=1348616 RepID=A0A9N8YZV0_9GLOM|nr:20987_t:CDS:1 [Dentiscutata erythropus]
MVLEVVLCITGTGNNCNGDHDGDYDRNNYRDGGRDHDRGGSRGNYGDNIKSQGINDGTNSNNANSSITATSADENSHPQTTSSNTINSIPNKSNTTNSTGSIPNNSNRTSSTGSITKNLIPTSTSQSNSTNTQSIQPTHTLIGSNKSVSADADTATNPFDSESPFHIPIIIGIVIIALIIILISYCLLKKTVFKKPYGSPNNGYILHNPMGENEPGISWKTSSLDSDTEIQPPAIAMASNRSSMVRIDQLINIDLNEDNNLSNMSDAQDFLEPARRSSAFLDYRYPNDFYRYSGTTLENVEHETIQQPAAAFI